MKRPPRSLRVRFPRAIEFRFVVGSNLDRQCSSGSLTLRNTVSAYFRNCVMYVWICDACDRLTHCRLDSCIVSFITSGQEMCACNTLKRDSLLVNNFFFSSLLFHFFEYEKKKLPSLISKLILNVIKQIFYRLVQENQ